MENSFQEKLDEELRKIEQTVKKPNILLLGGTGVGKSSLTNLIFRADIAKTGTGKPVTQEITRYEIEKSAVVLYDSVGFELSGENSKDEFISKIVEFASASKSKKVEEQIHLVWYHIQASGHRVTEWDLNLINKIKALNIPIAVVFTKCDLVTEQEVKELANEIKNTPCFEVTTNEKVTPKYLDLEKLIEWSSNNLEPALKIAFVKSQKVNLEEKKKNVNSIILQHTAVSAGVGFTPIPFADAPILLANQAGMVARILYVYDLDGYGNLLSTLLKTVSLGSLISTGGKWLVGELLKLIPVVGTIGGGMITGSVAAAVTAAMGYSVSEICFTISKFAIDGEESKMEDYIKNLTSIFKQKMKDNSII
jgi:small GTP-binding protein